MSVNFLVVLQKNENLGFGFSLLGKPGLPHIIYDVVQDSPASENQVSTLKCRKLMIKVTGAENRNFFFTYVGSSPKCKSWAK